MSLNELEVEAEPTEVFCSMLFAPGNRPDLVEKAICSEADAVIVDLEDAVPFESKANARSYLAELPESKIPLYVRVNGGDLNHLWPDLQAVGYGKVDGIVLPKAENAELIVAIDGALTMVELASGRNIGSTVIVPLIETSTGIVQGNSTLRASLRVKSVMFGSAEQGDLFADLGGQWTPDGTALLYARSQVLVAAKAAGVANSLDGPFLNLSDLSQLRVECELARRIGYTGKVAIHPSQVPIIHDVFTPSPAEIAAQQRVLDAFKEALDAGSSLVKVDGRMVDYAVAKVAQTVIDRADVARKREARLVGMKE